MLLNVVNPNTTAAMTAVIARAAEGVARAGTTIRAVESVFGPASIEGAYDDAFAVPGLLERIAEGETQGAAAHVIACFDDTGLDAARALASAPVIGIGEAGFHAASMLAHRFAVVTTLARSVPVLENNLLRYGLDRRCARVRACDVPVLELDNPASNARARLRRHGGTRGGALGRVRRPGDRRGRGRGRARRRPFGDRTEDLEARWVRQADREGLFRVVRPVLAEGVSGKPRFSR